MGTTIGKGERIKHEKLLLIAIGLGVLLNPLNSSMISVAMVRLQDEFTLGFAEASWLISVYYLGSAIAQPVMGKLTDLFGAKKIFLMGLVLVAISSLMAPTSETFYWLIIFRLIQAVGSGAVHPAGMAIVRKHYNERRARTLAMVAAFSQSAAAFGPSIGGFLIGWKDWEAIFLINFPIIIIGFMLAIWVLPKDKRLERKRERLRDLLDVPGIILFTIVIISGLLFLISLTDDVIWWAGGLTVLSLWLFILHEKKVPIPFIDLKLFQGHATIRWVNIQFITVNIIFYSTYFGFPIYFQELRGLGPQAAGMLMISVAGVSVLLTPFAGRWIERSGSRPALIFSALFLIAGSTLLVTWGTNTPIPWLIFVLILFGISTAFNTVGLQNALFENTPASVIGTVSGLFMTARYIGTILSTLLLAILYGNQTQIGHFKYLSFALTLLSLFILWMSWRLPRKEAKLASRSVSAR